MYKRKIVFWGTLFMVIILGVALNHISLVLSNTNDYKGNNTKKSSKFRKQNIFFILIETLRPDHLGCYGYKRNTSPNIDKIAREGIVFTNFYTVCPWTNPTVTSIFTGRFPQAIFPPAKLKKAYKQVLPEEIDTLAEILRKEGYLTIALSDHPAISKRLNYDQGFDIFVQLSKKSKSGLRGSPASNILEELSGQLDKVEGNYFFIYLHLMYPHTPYTPPSPYNRIFGHGFKEYVKKEKEGMINMYDGEIRYTDDLIVAIFDDLRKRGLLKNTYVIITSDHGEGFWEHGLQNHGNSLYNELLKVPLIIYPPGNRKKEPSKINDLTSNIDIFPTIMDIAGIEKFPEVDGQSLMRYFDKNYRAKRGKLIFSESPCLRYVNCLSCQNRKFKYIYRPEKSTDLLFNLREDPDEKNNLVNKKTLYFVYLKMKRHLIHHKKSNDRRRILLKQKTGELDKDSLEKLKSLGYLQ